MLVRYGAETRVAPNVHVLLYSSQPIKAASACLGSTAGVVIVGSAGTAFAKIPQDTTVRKVMGSLPAIVRASDAQGLRVRCESYAKEGCRLVKITAQLLIYWAWKAHNKATMRPTRVLSVQPAPCLFDPGTAGGLSFLREVLSNKQSHMFHFVPVK